MERLFDRADLPVQALAEPERWTDLINALSEQSGAVSATILNALIPDPPLPDACASDDLKPGDSHKVSRHLVAGGDETVWAVCRQFLKAPTLKPVKVEEFSGVDQDTDLPFCTGRHMLQKH